MRTEAASNLTCDHLGFSYRQGILPDLSNSDCLPGRAGGTPVGLAMATAWSEKENDTGTHLIASRWANTRSTMTSFCCH